MLEDDSAPQVAASASLSRPTAASTSSSISPAHNGYSGAEAPPPRTPPPVQTSGSPAAPLTPGRSPAPAPRAGPRAAPPGNPYPDPPPCPESSRNPRHPHQPSQPQTHNHPAAAGDDNSPASSPRTPATISP